MLAAFQITAETIVYHWGNSQFAAAELQAYIAEMSGLSLAVEEQPTGCSAHGLLLASEFTTPLCTPPAIEDGFLLHSEPDFVLLASNNQRGALYAAYALLERLGVRFFAPRFSFYEGNAEYIPSLPVIQIEPFYALDAPDMAIRRKDAFSTGSHTLMTMLALIDWMGKNRLNVLAYPANHEGQGLVMWDTWREQLLPEIQKRGIVLEVGGHGYQTFLSPAIYGVEHPDWVWPGGTLIGPTRNVFVVTNQEALNTYLDNVILYLRAHPEIAIFDAWPPDGARWQPEDIAALGSVANVQAHLVNALASRIAQEGLPVQVETIAYTQSLEPPTLPYAPGVLIDFAPVNRSYTQVFQEQTHAITLTNWLDQGYQVAIYEYYRKYSWHSLPNVMLGLISSEIPYFHAKGVRGLGIYSEPADWITYEPVHLLVARLSWDVSLTSYMRRYIGERYGAADGAMAAYFKLVENAGRLNFNNYAGQYENLAVMAEVRTAYYQARQALEVAHSIPGPGVFLIERLLINIDYAIADTEISYYAMTGEGVLAEAARTEVKRLLDEHRFTGILALNAFSLRRHDPKTTETTWIFDEYRREFDKASYLPIVFL